MDVVQLQAKPSAQSRNAEDSVRHLTYEDLDAYSGGRLNPARATFCRAHLESCEACRAELEDIRASQAGAAAFSSPDPKGRAAKPRKKRNNLPLPEIAIGGVVLAAVTLSAVWWFHWRQAPITHTLATTAAPVTSIAPADEGVPPPPVPAPLTNTPHSDKQPLTTSGAVGSKHAAAPGKEPAPAAATTAFALSGPFGTTWDSRPEFRWTPLPGASHYSIAIMDAKLQPVQRATDLKTTTWRPSHALKAGKTYLWQVTATLPNDSTVVLAQAPVSDATLRIVTNKAADEVSHYRKGHEDAHLVMGAMYAQAGMLTESEDELRKVSADDPSYGIAQVLLRSLTSTPHATPR